MTVHANSVIDVSIQNYDSALYAALTDKENNSYISTNSNIISGQEVATYQPQYQLINDAIIAYLASSRSIEIHDLFAVAYGYKMMNVLYGTDFSLESNLKATTVYNMNGETPAIKTSAVSAFSDYDGTSFAALTASISTITGSAAIEKTNITTSLIPSMTSIVKSQTIKLMVEDLVSSPPPSKQSIGQWLYGSGINDLGYASLNTPLNLGFSVPSYVT